MAYVEAHVQVRNYPSFLHAINNKDLPCISRTRVTTTTCFSKSPHNTEMAAKHQQAMSVLLRTEAVDRDKNNSAPLGFDEGAWNAMMRRSEQRDEPRCKSVALDDMSRGPGHVAWQFIEKAKNKDPPIVFNEEQLDCMALQIWDIEEAFRKQQGGETLLDTLRDSHVLVGGSTQAIRRKIHASK